MKYKLILCFSFIFLLLTSCQKDNTPVTPITEALKISAYVYDENGETWSFQKLNLNEPKNLVPTAVLQNEGIDMVNFNLHFEYEDGICIVSAPERNMQLSVGRNGDIWVRGEESSTRVFDSENNYELILSRAGYMAFAPFGGKNRNMVFGENEEFYVFYKNFEPYIGQEYILTVNACDFDKVPVITAQVKLTSLEDAAYDDGTSRYFSIELVSYDYSDIYKMMEGTG